MNANKKVIGVLTARLASTRLPRKVLMPLGGKSILEHHLERLKNVAGLDGVFLVTSEDPQNRELIAEAERLGCGWYAGAEQDIVDRHVRVCEREGADAFLRVTCDCPIFDIDSASKFVQEFKKEYRDYIYVTNMTMIQGTLSELVSLNAIKEVHKHYHGAAITAYIKENLPKFKTLGLQIDADLCRPEYRLTIDEQVDVDMVGKICEALYRKRPLNLKDVYTWLDDNPTIAQLNMHVGIKGCEQQSAGLVNQSVYSIVPSGKKYIVLDEQKRLVLPENFLNKVYELFPELKRSRECTSK